MSDLMLYGVLRMPYELAMEGEISRLQFYRRAQEAADRLDRADAEIAELRAALAATAPTVAVDDRPRLQRVIEFALRRFIMQAHDRANQAAQDLKGEFFKPGACEAFLDDAKDAEKAIRHVAELFKLSEVMPVDERDAFEAWAASYNLSLTRNGDDYASAYAHCAWAGWQARAKLEPAVAVTVDEQDAFEVAMLEGGFPKPTRNPFRSGRYVDRRDCDRYAGWKMARRNYQNPPPVAPVKTTLQEDIEP